MIINSFIPLLFALVSFHLDTQTQLEIEIGEFRNEKGHILLSVFDNAEDFPRNAENAVVNKKVKVNQKIHTISIDNLPEGDYAIVFLHDENGNEEMDTNFVGAPEEGYGASNDAVNMFSAPKYEEAKFTLGTEPLKIKMKIFY
ncbi:DUF2141 domain-containing protein [Marivirga arenosa]|uniref:DUF2141 domain-containing protein n=1 Tax=Marivirga arenosa TaxID=3059076 RepID=A0AA49GET5_9BACT|nr:DUF2141 domain-containing protein [Marivirga sp. ABR2-2]WKK85026.1 DUF2141 domain-containing protein [Marivirga sp. ABR2-2]